MLNHGEKEPASKNFDDVHRDVLQALVKESGLGAFSDEDLRTVSWDALHNLTCWPDFPAILFQGSQPKHLQFLSMSISLIHPLILQ
jgi:hypothetical protein